jgi:MFS family permease
MRMPFRDLPRNVRALGAVSLANDIASEMIAPLLPAFVTQVLGLGPAFLGTIEGVAESTASVFKLAAGWQSDRVRRRKAFALFGYGLSNLVRPLIGLATAGWQVLALRFTDRIGKGVRTSPRDAIVAAAVTPAQRGRAFGFHRAMDNLGATLGPLIAALLLALFPGHLREILILSIVPGVIAVLIMGTQVKEDRPAAAVPAARRPDAPALSGGIPTGVFRIYLIAVVLFTLGNSSDVFLALRGTQLGIPIALIPIAWTVLNLVRALASTPGGQLSDRIGRRPAIIAGWALYAAVYLGFGLARSAGQVWALFAVYGLYYGLVEGAERALVADLVGGDQRGRAFGWFHLSVGIGALPASVLFGIIWRSVGAPHAFYFGAIMALAGSLVLLFMKRGALEQRAPL